MRTGSGPATLFSVAAVLTPTIVQAQPLPGPEDAREIVVTASKKAEAEGVQDVPMAITAFDAAVIDQRKLRDLTGLTYAIPGVSLDTVGTFRGTANFSIRGLGINSSIASVDPAVGTFVDGIYLGVNAGVLFDLFDVQRIEVLRGPQGTLYGRNTSGGAVLVDTADPTEDWQLKLRGSLDGPVNGGRGTHTAMLQASLSGPLAKGLAFRLGAYRSIDGGYFRNLFNGGDLGNADTVVVRTGLSYQTARLRIVAKGEYLNSNGDGAVGQNHGLFNRDSFNVSLDNEGMIQARSWFGTLRADYELANGRITNIAGYRRFSQLTDNDIDSTPSFLFHSKTALGQEQVSNELRYARSFGRVDATLGGYLFHQKIAYQEDRLFPAGAPHFGGGRQVHHIYGLFGQSEYQLTPALALLGGLRWSREKKGAAVTYVRPRSACSVIRKTCPIGGTNEVFPAERNGFEEQRSWANFAPKLGLEYIASEGALFYGSWTRGYRSGGFNVRVTQPLSFEAVAEERGTHAYEEERVGTYELGAKLTGAGGKGTVNLAAYRSAVKDLQREVNVASATSGLAQSIFNTADARIWGGEAEARVALGRTVVSANAGYIRARYRNVRFDISSDGIIDAADAQLRLPRAPEWTFGGEILHSLSLGNSTSLMLRLAYQYRDAYAFTDSNFGWVSASNNLDADLSWNPPKTNFTFSLYGRNLLDDVRFGGDTQLGFASGPLSDNNNRPFDRYPAKGTFSPLVKGRMIGAEVTLFY